MKSRERTGLGTGPAWGPGQGLGRGSRAKATHSPRTYTLQDTDGHVSKVFAATAIFYPPDLASLSESVS